MKNSWVLWAVIVAVVVVVLIAFNYQGHKDAVSLSELFPEEEVNPVEMEYEIVTQNNEIQNITMKPVEAVMPTAASTKTAVPAMPTALPVVSKAASAPAVESSNSDMSGVKFTIQVASVQRKSGAEEVVKRLQKQGVSAFIVSKDLGAKGIWYRVYAGKFSTKDEANALLEKVKNIYSGSFIISPK